jgi:hypothetical protein
LLNKELRNSLLEYLEERAAFHKGLAERDRLAEDRCHYWKDSLPDYTVSEYHENMVKGLEEYHNYVIGNL